ncbi:MAG: transposase [Peptoniphilaceae bacterium]|nr:transposase [Peptoniphilaceae bacterium]MDY6085576.1 transposase [Peptoniphilaceae bacterium]
MTPFKANTVILDILLSSEENQKRYAQTTFYKERWFNENGLEQRYVATFSLKYKAYMERLRQNHLSRAAKMVERKTLKNKNPNNPARYVEQLSFTDDGEIADHDVYALNLERAQQESLFDGYYFVATNLDGDVADILRINRQRWEIVESFRILKTEFSARPVYLTRVERIQAHFLICFLALYLFRILEKEIGETYTLSQIIAQLRNFQFTEVSHGGYVPVYTRTALTDKLHEISGFQSDFEIVSASTMRKIIRSTKTK